MDRFSVLFVDDETNILNSIKRITIQEDFKSLFAASGEKALEQIMENEIAVIVTDMRMPKMNGLDLLEKVKEISPNTVRMVLSGYAQISQVIVTVNKVGVFKYITKPWNNEEEFLPAIHEALEYYKLVKENEIFKVQIEEKNKLYKKILDSNNNLVKNSQKDINYIKVVSKIIFDLKNNMYDNSKDECSRQKYINQLIDKVYFQYLETIPSISETFTLNSLQSKFDELKSRNLPIIYDNNNTAQINYLGNKRVFELIFNNVLEVITWDSKEDEVLLNFTHKTTLNINFFIRNKNNFLKTISKTEAKLILNFLDNLGKMFGGKITIVPDKFLININTGLKIAD